MAEGDFRFYKENDKGVGCRRATINFHIGAILKIGLIRARNILISGDAMFHLQ